MFALGQDVNLLYKYNSLNLSYWSFSIRDDTFSQEPQYHFIWAILIMIHLRIQKYFERVICDFSCKIWIWIKIDKKNIFIFILFFIFHTIHFIISRYVYIFANVNWFYYSYSASLYLSITNSDKSSHMHPFQYGELVNINIAQLYFLKGRLGPNKRWVFPFKNDVLSISAKKFDLNQGAKMWKYSGDQIIWELPPFIWTELPL